MKPSHVHLHFLDIIDKITVLLSAADKVTFDVADKCRSLMASDTHNIPLFTDPFLSKLTNCKSVFLLKILLLPLLSWLDHSILKELVVGSDIIMDLLTQFDSLIDIDKPVVAYPIPAPSQLMIPLDDKFAVVATKSSHDLSIISLKTVIDIKTVLIRTFEISSHAICLIAICTKLNYLYWMVPKCVISVIMDSIHNCNIQYELWQEKIVLTVVLPDLFSNDNDLNTQMSNEGLFSILSSQDDMVCVMLHSRKLW